MSIPLVQIGQCGNQVGGSFYETIIDDLTTAGDAESRINAEYEEISKKRFFLETSDKWKCCAVMVDTEEKAVSAVQNRHQYLTYPANTRVTGKRGCGNNWASGYCESGPRLENKVVDMVRSLMEQCDRVDGIMSVMSLAGGTGSGLGTRLCSAIRDAFPEANLMALPVWPFRRGEVSVQSYNALLSLSHLHNSVDAFMLIENDTIHDICKRRLGISNVSVNQLNKVIGHQVASLFQPVREVKAPLSAMLTAVVPHPDFKLLQIRCIPYMADNCREFATDQWQQLMRHLHQMLIADSFIDEGIDWSLTSKTKRSTQLATLVTLRGRDVDSTNVDLFSQQTLYPRWRQKDRDRCLVWRESRSFRQYARSACLITNGATCLPSLNASVSQAWRMFLSKSFIHQYAKHGFTEADFLDSFAAMEQLIYNYQHIND